MGAAKTGEVVSPVAGHDGGLGEDLVATTLGKDGRHAWDSGHGTAKVGGGVGEQQRVLHVSGHHHMS